jgi:hypothetical protein
MVDHWLIADCTIPKNHQCLLDGEGIVILSDNLS